MPRTATAKTDIQIAAEKARDAYKKAKEKFTKTNAPADKDAMTKAAAVLLNATEAENRERFVTLGGVRVKKIISAINIFAACAKPNSYSFSAEDISKAISAIHSALNNAENKFEIALSGDKKAPTDQIDFSF